MSDVERRLSDALDARADVEVAGAALLRQRRAEVVAATADDVTSLDSAVDHDDALAAVVGSQAARARRRRRVVHVLAVAAALLALAAAAVGVVRLSGRWESAPPAGGTAHSYAGLSRPQLPSDTAGAPFGSDVQRSSVRLLGQLQDQRFHAGIDGRGRLCWAVEHRSGAEGGCELERGPAEAVQLGASGAARAWLVPDGWDTSELTARGFTEAAPSLWLPRDAVGSPEEVFSALRRPQEASEGFGGAVESAGYTAGSERVLAKTPEVTYWVATDPAGEACLAVLVNQPQVAAGSCQAPLAAATGGLRMSTTAGSTRVEARVVPDGWSTAGWEEEEELLPLAPGLWVDRATGERAALEQLRAAATAPFAAEPAVATGTQELRVPAGTRSATVLVRCLTTSGLVVRVDGEVQGGTPCGGGPGAEPVVTAARPPVADGPVTITISGPAAATWAAAVVDLAAG